MAKQPNGLNEASANMALLLAMAEMQHREVMAAEKLA